MKINLSGMILFGFLSLSTLASAATLEDRVAELEAQQSLRTLQFGGFLQTFYDSIDTKQNTGGTIDSKVNYFRLKSSLNFNADVSERTKFYSRLTATKFFNATRTGSMVTSNADFSEGRDFKSSAVYLEKAYADISFYRSGKDSFIFTMGRLPTVDGPPLHLDKGQDRSGTYPMLGYDAIFDGFALTYNMGLSESSLAFRAVYTPIQTVNLGNSQTGIPPYLTSPTAGGNRVPNLNDLSALMIEWSKRNLSFASGVDVIFQHNMTSYSDIDGVVLGGTGAFATQFLGTTLTVSLSGIAGLPFDFSVSGASTTMKNKGVANSAALGGNLYGFGATSENEEIQGTMLLANARYGFGGRSFLGAEYYSASKGAVSPVYAQDDITNFYRTTGDAYKVYALYKPMDELAVRLSYAEQNSKYSDFSIGASRESDRKIKSIMATARLDF